MIYESTMKTLLMGLLLKRDKQVACVFLPGTCFTVVNSKNLLNHKLKTVVDKNS